MSFFFFFFFFNDTATTEIYTLSLHDALPISQFGGPPPGRRHLTAGEGRSDACGSVRGEPGRDRQRRLRLCLEDRKSTRLNSSHGYISYAVFCLKKKKTQKRHSRKLPAHTVQH